MYTCMSHSKDFGEIVRGPSHSYKTCGTMNNANDHETIGRSIVLSATPDEQNLFECNVKLVRKDTDWTIGLFIFSEGIYFVQQGSDKVIMIPIKDITNVRPGKPGAKQVKLQIKRSFKTKTGETKDVPYTFIFPEAQSNAQELMNKCRDVLVTLMFKRLKPEDRQKHFDNLTLEQKQKLTALNTDESLKRLHRQLVGGGTLTDDEFWSENMVCGMCVRRADGMVWYEFIVDVSLLRRASFPAYTTYCWRWYLMDGDMVGVHGVGM
ncbi:hypothetical protein SARC_10581 [Sphaeroforma arctica JP610]|uniref:TFIIH p62 subunit N-terminal domain-containing protein n=1 Tax=Sphaeroforma arctica JP610 TaxID=667725 RepID=A0A0L0FLP7_9EUKA|nr:hypothetical protein SARC_10581 [Sphaeroforma arctica JP610]KNC76943.1 hypothetical protein SARC_10581 [Sphaeroforma arctica JP610]|eukprot:XP_014150845.1 hypothetical protein SARC_10581 [Sphaeroforma arctica JP610]